MHAHKVLNQLCEEHHIHVKDFKNDVENRKPYIGVRFPRLVEISKTIQKDDPIEFIESNDCSVYELEILQTYTIGYLKDLNLALYYFDQFAHIAHDWSTVDSLCQHFTITKKYPREVFQLLEKYAIKDDEYLQRIVAVMILSHYLNDEYIERSLELILKLNHQGYYTKMAVAWALATMMIHYSHLVIPCLESHAFDPFTHNKAIQKTIESFRITAENKEKVKALKR